MPQVMERTEYEIYVGIFPLVGLVQAAPLIGWVYLAQALSVGTVLFAAVAALIPLFVTGGIHLTDFCDTVDALASHQTREKKLEILKDPHTGAFAVMGCMAYLLPDLCALDPAAGENFACLAAKEMAVGYVFSPRDECGSCLSPCAKNSGLAHSFFQCCAKDRVRIISILFALIVRSLLCADSSGAGCGDSGRQAV